MAEIHINGGRVLGGEMTVQGSKNAVLPIMAASVLCKGETRLKNVPDIQDVWDMLAILRQLGCKAEWTDTHEVWIDARCLASCEVVPKLMEKMRSSIFLLGPLLARLGCARLHMPGGCRIGERPIDLHLTGLRSMGASVTEDEAGLISAEVFRLEGCNISLRFPSVGATENLVMAAVLAEGATCIHGCAREPEVVELCCFLRAMGAQIKGIGSGILWIYGIRPEQLHGVSYSVGGDRIAAATYLSAAAGCRGELIVHGVYPAYLTEVIGVWKQMGLEVTEDIQSIAIKSRDRLQAVKWIRTAPYPAFPTDMQSVILTLLSCAEGTSYLEETIFEKRFLIAPELEKFGARLQVSESSVMIKGVKRLKGARVHAADLRGGAALVLAGLMAEGESVVSGVAHIERGYEKLTQVLAGLGADVSLC